MDCETPKCHEQLKLCIEKKVSKKTMWRICWGAFGLIGLPFLLMSIEVWSRSEHGDKAYIPRTEMEEHIVAISTCRENMARVFKDIEEIKEGQKENGRDIKEILRHLRDR